MSYCQLNSFKDYYPRINLEQSLTKLNPNLFNFFEGLKYCDKNIHYFVFKVRTLMYGPFQLTANIEGEGAEFVFFFNLKLLAINVPNEGRRVRDKRKLLQKKWRLHFLTSLACQDCQVNLEISDGKLSVEMRSH